MMLPVSTSTIIFHELILPLANEIRFVKGRIRFIGVNSKGDVVTNSTGMADSMIVIFDLTRKTDLKVSSFERP